MRVKLSFPNELIFESKIRVHISDINYGGHMGNDRFLTMMQEARMQWLQSGGFINEKDIEPPVGLIVVDSMIQYKAEVFHGEILCVSLAVKDISSKSFDLYYSIKKEAGQVAAIGKTGIVCYDNDTKKVVTIPANLLKILS
jgi:YbgC/YbaW family acyl-CoA thioester hydrolase